jgi:hypothetical protein
MQKWEYKIVKRTRNWAATDKDSFCFEGGEFENGVTKSDDDFGMFINSMGDDGWELINVIPESDFLGGHYSSSSGDYAGFTSTEKYLFKKPKENLI